MQDKPIDAATKADVANVQDDLNTFKGSTDKSFASVWKAIDGLSKKSPDAGGAGAADHEHVPAGHAPYSDDRATGSVADSSAKPTGKDAGQVIDEEPAAAST